MSGLNQSYLQQAAAVLGSCGQIIKSDYGGRQRKFIPIPKGFLFQTIHANNTVSTEPLGITGDTVFMLRALQGQFVDPFVFNAFYLQIQTPDGKNLFGSPVQAQTFLNAGSQRYLLGRPLFVEPGKRFLITADDTYAPQNANFQNVSIPIAISFEGAYLYEVQDSGNVTPVLASDLPRYFGNFPSQNILAPEVALSFDQGTPPGFIDREFIYSDPNVLPQNPTNNIGSLISSRATGANTRVIQMQPNSEFEVRRILFVGQNVSGQFNSTVQVKIRDHTGFAYTSDFVTVQMASSSGTYTTGLLSNSVFPCKWRLCPAGNAAPALIFEYRIVDTGGSLTTISMQTCVLGVRRVRA